MWAFNKISLEELSHYTFCFGRCYNTHFRRKNGKYLERTEKISKQNIATCKIIQDSLAYWILLCAFRIPGTSQLEPCLLVVLHILLFYLIFFFAPSKIIRIPESGKFLLVGLEYWELSSRNPSSTTRSPCSKWSWVHSPWGYPGESPILIQGSYKKFQPFFKDFPRSTFDFQGPPMRKTKSALCK